MPVTWHDEAEYPTANHQIVINGRFAKEPEEKLYEPGPSTIASTAPSSQLEFSPHAQKTYHLQK